MSIITGVVVRVTKIWDDIFLWNGKRLESEGYEKTVKDLIINHFWLVKNILYLDGHEKYAFIDGISGGPTSTKSKISVFLRHSKTPSSVFGPVEVEQVHGWWEDSERFILSERS